MPGAIMLITNGINNYKKNEATIEMLKIKINQWKDILTKDIQEIDLIYSKHQDNLGVQKSHNSNPIESMYIRVEEQKKKIKLWIEDSEKKIKKLEQDKKIVNILISSLDEETKFIIEQKHFENKKWNIITHQFNSNYRTYKSTFDILDNIECTFSEYMSLCFIFLFLIIFLQIYTIIVFYDIIVYYK